MKRQITITLITLSLVALLLSGLSFTSNGRNSRASPRTGRARAGGCREEPA